MSARIIDGKKLSTASKADVAERVAKLKQTHGIQAGLTVVLVGEAVLAGGVPDATDELRMRIARQLGEGSEQ